MRVETLPLIVGAIVALLGIGIIFDAWTPDVSTVSRERRRRPRIERHRNGEALIGFGVLALAGAFIGRDNWSYSVLVVIIGALFLLVGAVLNRQYVREMFVNRGPLRRREQEEATRPTEAVASDGPAQPDAVADASRAPAHDEAWNGVERRAVPRERDRQRAHGRDSSSEERPRG